MEVKIGVLNAPRELTIETDESAESLATRIAEAARNDEVLQFADARGRAVLVAGKALAYAEFGSSTTGQVGFRS